MNLYVSCIFNPTPKPWTKEEQDIAVIINQNVNSRENLIR